MKEIEVSSTTDASKEQVLEALCPESIIQHAETFDIDEIEENGNGTLLTVSGGDIVMKLEFERTKDGYHYRQVDEKGPYKEMETMISVRSNDQCQVWVHSKFTFGGPLAFITDRWAVGIRKEEINRLLSNLVFMAEQQETSAETGDSS